MAPICDDGIIVCELQYDKQNYTYMYFERTLDDIFSRTYALKNVNMSQLVFGLLRKKCVCVCVGGGGELLPYKASARNSNLAKYFEILHRARTTVFSA